MYIKNWKQFSESIKYNEKSQDVSKMQQVMVDLGINIGEFGKNKDGVDGIAGRFTFAGVNILLDLLRENKMTDLEFDNKQISDELYNYILSLDSNEEIKKIIKSNKQELLKKYKDTIRIDNPDNKVKDFIEKYSDVVVQAAKETKNEHNVVLFPSLMLAQAALESGWGKSRLTKNHNNFFGIKATSDWKGDIINKRTREVFDGEETTIKAPFRSYTNPLDSFKDRNSFLVKNPRYANAGVFRADNPVEQAELLQKAGYATDPNYAKSISEIIYQYGLEDLDKKI